MLKIKHNYLSLSIEIGLSLLIEIGIIPFGMLIEIKLISNSFFAFSLYYYYYYYFIFIKINIYCLTPIKVF